MMEGERMENSGGFGSAKPITRGLFPAEAQSRAVSALYKGS